MYRKILVPLDFSKESEQVLPIVSDLHVPGAEVILLHVISPHQTLVHDEYRFLGTIWEDTERSIALSHLKYAGHCRIGTSGKWRCEVVVSRSVTKGIVDFALREEVDLIAMYTHDRKGLAKLIKGSIAEKVQKNAPIEVKVFRPNEVSGPIPIRAPAGENLALKKLILRETDLFRGLSDARLDCVAALAQLVQVKTGQVLGRSGELSDHLFVILEGDAQLYTRTPVGDVTVRIIGPEELFPLASLVGEGTQITSSVAMTDMELLAIPRAALVSLCSRDPDIAMQVYSAVAATFAERYRNTLAHLSINAERVLRGADFLERVEEPRVLS